MLLQVLKDAYISKMKYKNNVQYQKEMEWNRLKSKLAGLSVGRVLNVLEFNEDVGWVRVSYVV